MLKSDAIQLIFNKLKKTKKVLIIFFDQFEERDNFDRPVDVQDIPIDTWGKAVHKSIAGKTSAGSSLSAIPQNP